MRALRAPFNPGAESAIARISHDWNPERSPSGPITILISSADRALYVYRNGNPIGRAALEVSGRGPLGGHVFTMLVGVTEKPSWWAPNRPGRKWSKVTRDEAGRRVSADELAPRLRFNAEFASKLYDAAVPGTTVIVTDQPAVRNASRDFTILAN